jgi:hypothetical protein
MSRDVGLDGVNNMANSIKSYQFAKLPRAKRIAQSNLKFKPGQPKPIKDNKPEPLDGELIEPSNITKAAPRGEEIYDAEIIEPKKPIASSTPRAISAPGPKAIDAPVSPVASSPRKVSSQRVNPMSLSDTSHMPSVDLTNIDLPRQFNGKA